MTIYPPAASVERCRGDSEAPSPSASAMHSHAQYLPMTPGFFAILVLVFGALIILIQLGILRYAYMKLGVSSGTAMLLLFGSLIGSYFNIPVTVLPGPVARSGEII